MKSPGRPGGAEVFGRRLQELRTREELARCILTEDRERVDQMRLRVVSNGGRYETEYRVLWPDGEVHWIRALGEAVEDPERGKLLLGVSQDITAKKLREERLKAQAKLFDMAYEPILVRDPEDRITHWNSGAERLYGYSWEEAKGRLSHDLLRTKFPEPLSAITARLENTRILGRELIHCAKHGHLIHVASRWQRFWKA